MRFPFVRLVPAALVATLVACGTPEAGAERLKELTVGITRDSAITLLGEGTLAAAQADTIRVDHGHRRSRYLIQGKFYTVLYVRDEPGDVNEPVTQSLETPIVFGPDNTVLGWGWKFYVDEAMATYGLPTPLRKIDTLTTPSAPKVDSGVSAPATTPATAPAAVPAPAAPR
jgi:hypothetical protein